MSGGNGPRTVLYDSDGDNPLIGQGTSSGSLPVVIALDQPPITVNVGSGTLNAIVAQHSVTISGSVPLIVTGSISNFPATQVVSGSNWVPSVLGLSGSVTGLLVGGQPLSVANPIPITGSISVTPPAVQNVTGSNWIPTVTGSVVVANQVNVTGSNWIPSVVGLSGSVVGLIQGGLPVSMTNPVPITGTMAVQGVVAVSGSMDVTGSVKLSQAPQVLQGTSPWIVSGSGWVPQITGSVVVANRVDVTGSNWVPTITGSVVVQNQVNVTGSNWVPQVTGSVRVTNIVDVTGSNWVPQITGSVRVTNIVDVTGSNWIPQVTGSVRVTNRVDVTGSAWTPVVTGSVRVENVVNVTGSNWVQTSTIAGYMSASLYGISGTTQLNLAVDSQGRVITAPAGATSTNAGFVFGKMDTTVQVLGVIEHTTYTEQTSNAQRSIVSTSGSDHWNSGSAQQVTITYYTVSGSGPKTEVINLSGTNSANTVNIDICFIEKMEVTRAGAYTTNSGTISLKAAINGGGATIGSIGGSAGQTFWCHHYIPSGSTCYITGLLGGKNNNTSAGSGGTFHIKATPLNVSTPIKKQISDFLNAYGQANSVERIYGTPITVVGPQKIDVWVYPDSALTTTYIASIDFYEQTS